MRTIIKIVSSEENMPNCCNFSFVASISGLNLTHLSVSSKFVLSQQCKYVFLNLFRDMKLLASDKQISSSNNQYIEKRDLTL